MTRTDEPPRPDRSQAPSAASEVRRNSSRGAYDSETIHAVIDACAVAHLGFVASDGRPVVVPTLMGRSGNRLYLHGSVASRMVRRLASGLDCCVTATIVDGLVLARSAFHHSMNYRSAMVFGRAELVDGDEALEGLRALSEHLLPGRWDEVRAPSEVELRQTAVLALTIDEASAKIRTGDPIDEPEDLRLDVWAGVLPIDAAWGAPVDAADLVPGISLPGSVTGADRPTR